MRTIRVLALLGILVPVAVWGAESLQAVQPSQPERLLRRSGLGDAAVASYKVEEVALGPIPTDVSGGNCSLDGWHMAYVTRKGDKQLVVLDGQAGPEYNRIGLPTWSPDGLRLAYVAVRGQKSLVVVDGQPGPEWDAVEGEGSAIPMWFGAVVFSADSKRVIYKARKGDKRLVVVDGQAGPEYDSVFPMRGRDYFTPDGKRFAYQARDGKKFQAVVDGQPGFKGLRIQASQECQIP